MGADRQDELEVVFNNAIYIVYAPEGELRLRIGEDAPALRQLLHKHGTNRAAIITAHNPGARRQGAAANQAAQARLLHQAEELQLPLLHGHNRAEQGDGPVEPTVVILGIERQDACKLARDFDQVALVYIGEHAPEVVWL